MLKSLLALLCLVCSFTVHAHDPIFGLGPHVLYKGGLEISAKWHATQSADRIDKYDLELTYGLSGDWAMGLESSFAGETSHRNVAWFSKYRFWRQDRLGMQQSAAVLLRREKNGNDQAWIAGMAWGYESRRYYRWASLRYRINQKGKWSKEKGNAWKLDLVAGYRPWLTGYLEPDSVFLFELNGEHVNGTRYTDSPFTASGGTRWFVSPGIFWTLRNFALKAGIQVPVSQNLEIPDQKVDYRVNVTLEWHL